MWMYKICKIHKNNKTYTVWGRYSNKREAERAAEQAAFFDHHEHKFIIKRYSEKEF